MKDKNLENRLRAEAEGNTPDLEASILKEAESEGLFAAQKNETDAYSGGAAVKAVHRKNKKLIAALISFMVAVVLAIGIIIPVLSGGGGSGLAPELGMDSVEGVYAFGAVSTAKLLGAVPATAEGTAATYSKIVVDDQSLAEEESAKFNQYFTAINDFLGQELLSVNKEDSGNALYPIKLIINGRDPQGNATRYELIYKETLTVEENTGNKVKNRYDIEGIMNVNGADCRVLGTRKTKDKSEADKTESKEEIVIRAYADESNPLSYVEMKQEIETENKANKTETETEIIYSVYSNGVLVERTAVELEHEIKNGKEEIEYEIKFIAGANKGKYQIEKEIVGTVTKFKVKYDIDGEKGEFKIKEIVENGEARYVYTFGNGHVKDYLYGKNI